MPLYNDPVIGKDVLLYFLINGIYQQAACADECGLNVYTNTVEITTRTNNPGQGTWRKIKPTDNYWDGYVKGIQLLDTPVKFSDIRQMQVDLTPIYIQYAKESQSGTRHESWFGRAVITSTSETAGVDDFATFDISLEGDGVMRADFEATNLNQPIEMFYYYTATGLEGRSFSIPDLRGYLINGRIYRDGLENDPSGSETMNRPATATPIGSQYRWDSNNGQLTLADDAPSPAFGERIMIPYTQNYSGCSLFIQNFKVALNGSNHFVFTWTGTGLPPSQLLFEYSEDYGLTWKVFEPDLDDLNLDNAVYDALDITGHYIFQLTPVCTNDQKGKPSRAYWNAGIAMIINNRSDNGIILFITYNDTATTQVSFIANNATEQLSTVNLYQRPYSAAKAIYFNAGGATPMTITITVKATDGTILGSTTQTVNSSVDQIPVTLNTYIPGEFIIVID